MGLGAQDDFNFALRFVDATGVRTPTMLWDPSFATWQSFGIQANSQMMVMSPDLETGSNLIFGFSADQQASILDFANTLAG